jgi:hypothetical protein
MTTMSILIQDRSTARHYVAITCRCGRSLRAKPEQVGGEITCWDCHAPVLVPIPVAPGNWVARLLRMGARQVLEGTTLTLIAIGALVVTLSLRIPVYGVWGAAAALSLVMAGYGELLRRGSQGDWTPRPHVSPFGRLWRLVVCLGAGSALTLPLFVAYRTGTSPRATVGGLLTASVLILLVPLLMLATFGVRGRFRDRFRTIEAMLVRHPMAVLASLLILPFSLVAVEVALVLLTSSHGSFGFFTLDLFPNPRSVRIINNFPFFGNVIYHSAEESKLMEVYNWALKQGYTLIGAIPASLFMPISHQYWTDWVFDAPWKYLIMRMLFTVFIVTCMLAALAVQARWLGLLSTMDSRRPAA